MRKKLRDLFNRLTKRPKQDSFKPVSIETPNLILRELEMSDAKRIFEITTAPGFKYFYFDGTMDSVTNFLKLAVETRTPANDNKRPEYLLAVVQKDTNELIGHVSLQRVNYVKGYEYDVNFFIDPACQNKGFGREAVVNMMNYAIEDLGLPGFTVTVHPDNKPSLKVALTEGSQQVGETTLKTAWGEEPRVILMLTKDAFRVQRTKDKRQMILPKTSGVKAPKP